MPITLPTGVTVALLQDTTDGVLSGSRVTDYRFDLLSNEEDLIGELNTVSGGEAEWSAFTAIKGGGSIDMKDAGTDIDWLNARIRPTIILTGETGEREEYPLGVFLPSAPVENWDATGRSWRIELLDKCSIPDQDIVVDSNGDPVTYVAPAGANVIATVVSLIEGVGEKADAVTPGTETLVSAMTWDLGTSVLQIINDLLQTAGYASLWVDGMGQFQVTKYVSPASRPPVYETLSPFSKGDLSLMSPEWQRDRDIYSIPNRYVAVSQGSGDTEGWVSVVTNTDPGSPFSYPSRGRWITRVETGIEATSEANLQARALMGLAQASSVTSGLTVAHPFLPELRINSTIRFNNPDAGLDILCYVTKTTIPFSPTDLCKTEIREAVV